MQCDRNCVRDREGYPADMSEDPEDSESTTKTKKFFLRQTCAVLRVLGVRVSNVGRQQRGKHVTNLKSHARYHSETRLLTVVPANAESRNQHA